MWVADIFVDWSWLLDHPALLGEPQGRATQKVFDPDLDAQFLLYGDDEQVRHLRIVLNTDDKATADACLNKNIQRWVNSLEVASSIATRHFSTADTFGPEGSLTFVVIDGPGDEHSALPSMEIMRSISPKADLKAAAQLMSCWKPDFQVHLHFLSRFLNKSLPIDVRWLNGYRVLEWHFLRGEVGLQSSTAYREFLAQHGVGLDGLAKNRQSKHGLIEQIRAQVAHALVAAATAPDQARPADLVVATFPLLEHLVLEVMQRGSDGTVAFRPTTPKNLSSQRTLAIKVGTKIHQ